VARCRGMRLELVDSGHHRVVTSGGAREAEHAVAVTYPGKPLAVAVGAVLTATERPNESIAQSGEPSRPRGRCAEGRSPGRWRRRLPVRDDWVLPPVIGFSVTKSLSRRLSKKQIAHASPSAKKAKKRTPPRLFLRFLRVALIVLATPPRADHPCHEPHASPNRDLRA
jgi:hypothetical protein